MIYFVRPWQYLEVIRLSRPMCHEIVLCHVFSLAKQQFDSQSLRYPVGVVRFKATLLEARNCQSLSITLNEEELHSHAGHFYLSAIIIIIIR